MEIRYAVHPDDMKAYTTEQVREHFLISNLFAPERISHNYVHYDRMMVSGAMPIRNTLHIHQVPELHTEFFLERRELGIVNVGGAGVVNADGTDYDLHHADGLYVGKGVRTVSLRSTSVESPAKFYMVSAPAHASYETRKIPLDQAQKFELGSAEESNQRTLYRFIHADGVQSCQLMLGVTALKSNSIWNTMPAHLHDRRMEVYLYFDVPDDHRVFHLMGYPQETRHLVVANGEAVVSPSWSIHSGVGTRPYSFVWAMAGENYTFDDMDPLTLKDLM